MAEAAALPGDSGIGGVGRRLADSPVGPSLLHGQPLAPFTTYGVGGPARLMVEADDLRDLASIASAVADASAEAGCVPIDVLLLGKGSNLLVADSGFDGLVVRLGSRFKDFSVDAAVDDLTVGTVGESKARRAPSGGVEGVVEEGFKRRGTSLVAAGGAVLMPVLARACAAAGLRGFEWAVGVPGTVGGAVRMNAGCHGSDMSAVLVDATVVDLHSGAVSLLTVSDLSLGYRDSGLKAHQAVAGIRLRLAEGNADEARSELADLVCWRRRKQPGGRNAGSVFANPRGSSAGQLIESAGLKGLRIAAAEVSAKHANFIQVNPAGRSRDVLALMTEVRRRVSAVHGVALRVETRLAGFTHEELAGLR